MEKKIFQLHWKNRYIKLSLSTKTIISFLVILLVPVVGIYIVNSNVVRHHMTEVYIDNIRTDVPAILDIVNEAPDNMQLVFSFIAAHKEFKTRLEAGDYPFVSYTLTESRKAVPAVNALMLLNPHGEVVGSAFGTPGGVISLEKIISSAIRQKHPVVAYELLPYDTIEPFIVASQRKPLTTVLAQVVAYPVFTSKGAYALTGIVVMNENAVVPNKVYDLFTYDTALFMNLPASSRIVSTNSRPKNLWTVAMDLPAEINRYANTKAPYETLQDIDGIPAATVTTLFADISGNPVGGISVALDVRSIQNVIDSTQNTILIFALLAMLLTAFIGGVVYHDTSTPVTSMKKAMEDVAQGKLNIRLDFKTYDDFEDLAHNFNEMVAHIEDYTLRINRYNKLNEIIITTLDTEKVLFRALEKLIEFSNSQVGVVYLYDREEGNLKPSISVNVAADKLAPVKMGDGIAGRAAVSRTYVTVNGFPPESITVGAGILNVIPQEISAFPLVYKKNLIGVILLGSLATHGKDELDIINSMVNQIAIVVDNTIQHKKVEDLSIRDELTSCYNRRYILEAIRKEIVRAKRYEYPFSIAIFDLDDFKKINDTYGHILGDKVLREFAASVHRRIRQTDTLGRYGGEEFVLLMPHTGRQEAVDTIERLKGQFWEDVAKVTGVAITASIGIATYPEHGSAAEDVLKMADDYMYEAKNSGKNRIVSKGNRA